jgi:virulence factor Mce-like protein
VIAQAIVALAFVVVLLRAEGVRLPFTGGGDWTISAAFADAGGIHTGERTPVLVSGVPSGSVTSVSAQYGLAIVTMRLPGSARGIIRTDATAAIEPRSALEDMTVDISPGSPPAPAARPGMRIAAAQTESTTTLDRVTAIMDADTRAQLAILLGQLAAGIRGRGSQLQGTVDRLHALLDPATQVTDALARRRTLITELVDALSRIGASAERSDVALAGSLDAGARTLGVTARRQASIAATVQGLPATVSALDGALRSVQSLAGPLLPTLRSLSSTAAALPAALSSARQTVPAASSLLHSASAFSAPKTAGALRSAAAVLANLKSVATALTPAISRVEPIVSDVNAHRQGIGLLGERFSGVLSTNDANGPVLRGLGDFEPFNPADFGYPSATGAQKTALAAQAVQALTLTCLHGGLVACVVRYLIPGLPGSVR